MGKIKKILENELVGGTQTTDIYPVTSIKAVYDENNERLDNILGGLGDKIGILKNAGYLYAGVATIDTNPGTPDAKVFYIANGKGTYEKFGGLEVTEDEVVVLYWDSAWHKVATGIASQEKLSELKEKVDALALGAFYGYFPDSASLPTDVTTPGYSYVGLDNPYKIWNFNGESWSDSGTSIDMNDADEEDITRNADGKLQFKDRSYGDGMGYVILRKDKTFAEQITQANTIYEIRYDFDLGGSTFSLPNNVYLKFAGGRIFNGILQGSLLNEEFNLRDIGVTTSATGETNRDRIALLSGLTSNVKMIVSQDMTLSGGEISFATKSFSMEGRNGSNISLSSFRGFSAKRISAKSLSVTSSASVMFKIPSFVGAASFSMTGCRFTGDIRVLSSLQYADELNHYVESFFVADSVFENVYCSQGNNTLFMLIDCIVNRSEIRGNTIHNSTAIAFNLGITNGSTYESMISTTNRILSATDNVFYNDLSFKPWEDVSITQPGAYLCFILMEKGQAYVNNNIFKNVLANNAGCACYDNYLSLEFLSFENNVWENCGNLTGEYIILMKGKGGTEGKRFYKNNTYLLSDLSQSLGIEDKRGTISPQIVSYESTMDFVEISGNVIQMSGIYCNPYLTIKIKNFVFKNNKLLLDSLVTNTGVPCLFSMHYKLASWEICGNHIEVADSVSDTLYFLGAYDSVGTGHVIAKDNVLIGFDGICGNINNIDNGTSLIIADNRVSIGNKSISSSIIFYGRYLSLEMKGNLFEYGAVIPIINGINKEANLTIDLKTNSTEVAVYAVRAGNRFPIGIYAVIVTVRNKETGVVRKCQLNFENNNGTITNVAYDVNRNLNTSLAIGEQIYSEGGGFATLLSGGLNIQRMLNVDNIYEINVCVKQVADLMSLSVIPKSVTTASRPILTSDDAGFTIMDKTIGKMILWNGTAWVNMDGSALE